MARGWESKSVEEQIAERQESREQVRPQRITAKQREIQQKRGQLMLMRANTLSTLQLTRSEVYRRQLQEALKHIDSELALLGIRGTD